MKPMIYPFKYDLVCAIDPGLDGTGYVFLNYLPGGVKGCKENPRVLVGGNGVIRPRTKDGIPAEKEGRYIFEIASIIYQLNLEFLDRRSKNIGVYIEEPTLWANSAKSYAAGVRGDLHKLSALWGAIACLCFQHGFDVGNIPVAAWKGQMTKEAVIYRLQKREAEGILDLGGATLKDHLADAIGIGLYVLNLF